MNIKDIKIYILANEQLDARTKESVMDLKEIFGCSLHKIKQYRKELGIQKKDTPPIPYKRFDESPEFKDFKQHLLRTQWVISHE